MQSRREGHRNSTCKLIFYESYTLRFPETHVGNGLFDLAGVDCNPNDLSTP